MTFFEHGESRDSKHGSLYIANEITQKVKSVEEETMVKQGGRERRQMGV